MIDLVIVVVLAISQAVPLSYTYIYKPLLNAHLLLNRRP
jgi:hypothetical protein